VLAVGVPAGLIAACSSSNPPVEGGGTPGVDSGLGHVDAPTTSTIDASDGATPVVDSGGASEGAVAFDAGLDAADAADAFDAGPPPPVCPLDASLGTTVDIVNTGDRALLGGVTPDELMLAWTDLADGGPVISWSERPTTADPFGATQTMNPSFGPFPADHVALSGDGLRIAFATPDQTQMVEVSRTARGTPFTTVSTNKDFKGVNPTSGAEGSPGIGPFAAPTISPDYGIWAFLQGTHGAVVSRGLSFGEWQTPPVLPSGLAPPASSPQTIIPTGWSSDSRTLFYWDTTAQVAVMAWLDPYALQFVTTELLGTEQQYAVPSGDCGNIYFTGSVDIFVAPRH
jgi:hypothetical protein